MAKYWECKYCDGSLTGFVGGDRVCASCGAEWENAKVLVEYSEKELAEFEIFDFDDDEDW